MTISTSPLLGCTAPESRLKPDTVTVLATPSVSRAILPDLVEHGLGARQRRGIRKLDVDEEDALVLGRNEGRGRALEHQVNGAAHQHHDAAGQQRTPGQHAGDARIAVARAIERRD